MSTPFAPPGSSGILPAGYAPQSGYSYDPSALPPPPQQSTGPGMTGVPGTPQQPYYIPQAPQWGGAQHQQVPQQPQYTQQPYGQPQQQPYQQPQQQPAQQPNRVILDDNVMLDGPAVPPELRGRTWGQARQMYSALSTRWLQQQQPQLRPPTLTPQPYQQPQAQPQQPVERPAASFFQNPQEFIQQSVTSAIQQQVVPMLQPILQGSQQQATLQAREVARAGIRDFADLEPDIMAIVASANPQSLSNPQTWEAAADIARGRRGRMGYAPQQQPQPQQRGGPGMSVPAYNPPPTHSFFTESPSAPAVPGAYGQQTGPMQLTADDQFHARKFGMTDQEYMQWKSFTMNGAPSSGGRW